MTFIICGCRFSEATFFKSRQRHDARHGQLFEALFIDPCLFYLSYHTITNGRAISPQSAVIFYQKNYTSACVEFERSHYVVPHVRPSISGHFGK